MIPLKPPPMMQILSMEASLLDRAAAPLMVQKILDRGRDLN
jgi:hypothetical protein